MSTLRRRSFLSSLLVMPSAFGIASTKTFQPRTSRLKTSLNAFSFNDMLLGGQMDVFELIDYCAETGFDAVDITGYYLKGYPQAPDDEYLYKVKRRAFDAGLEISGTGVRNNFTLDGKEKRGKEVQLVKDWVHVAAKIGAPVIRIFAGQQDNSATREQVTEWMIEDIKTCVDYGKQHGVVIGLQNHADFLQTAEQINYVIESVNSEWLGLILDTGSYRVYDPYEEIKKSVKHAVNWQIKEKIFIGGNEVDTDIQKLMKIIKESSYKGYLPIETLGKGDPKVKVPALLAKLIKAMSTPR
ncbi:MAG: sugar phosphate isomerase/epimerase [Chitinophagaceae bacterium]|nr:sugar phosphate isomerase/epimerase [Chitinophagaceae bacterium]